MIWHAAMLILITFLASVASFSLKKTTANGISPAALFQSPFFYLGVTLYIISALGNLYLLKRLPYSLIVPLGSMTYVWTMLISKRYLGEEITKRKLAGVGLILAGVSLIAVG